jgi:hypothetical protein
MVPDSLTAFGFRDDRRGSVLDPENLDLTRRPLHLDHVALARGVPDRRLPPPWDW